MRVLPRMCISVCVYMWLEAERTKAGLLPMNHMSPVSLTELS